MALILIHATYMVDRPIQNSSRNVLFFAKNIHKARLKIRPFHLGNRPPNGPFFKTGPDPLLTLALLYHCTTPK